MELPSIGNVLGYVGLPLVILFGMQAVRHGGKRERLALAIVLAWWGMKLVLQIEPSPPISILAGSITAVVLFLISARYRRIWLLLMSSCTVACTFWHSVMWLTPGAFGVSPMFLHLFDFLTGIVMGLCFWLAAWEADLLRNQRMVDK